MRDQVNRFDGARHDANAREHGYNLVLNRQIISPRVFTIFGLLLILVLIVFASRANAQDTTAVPPVVPYWNLPKAEYVFDAVDALDMLTTIDGQRARNHDVETNGLLGQHPNQFQIVAFFVGGALLHAAITDRLPERWVPAWEALSISVEGYAFAHNYRLGLRVRL